MEKENNKHFNNETPPNFQTEKEKVFVEKFRKEINQMKEKDIKQEKPAHLFEVNPEELILKDAEIWERVKNETVTKDDFQTYKSEFIDKEGNFRENLPKSRLKFLQFIANKVNVIFLNQQIKKKV